MPCTCLRQAGPGAASLVTIAPENDFTILFVRLVVLSFHRFSWQI